MTALPIVDARPEHVPGDKERALAALWEHAGRRVHTLPYWRETIALRRRFSLRFLRLGELQVRVPALTVPDCEACTDLCCTGDNAVVSLRLRDIAALTDAGLERFIVADRSAVAPPAEKASWARREADDSIFHRVFPVLARDATGTCALLTEDRLCGAFPAWPLSCARYPYALDLQTRTVFWAKGCGHAAPIPAGEAPPRMRALLRAVVDGYNERLKDAVLLYVARAELEELGLLRHLRIDQLR